MAALVSNNYADYFIKLAVLTSAWLLIILASLILLCLAADVKSFSISGGIIICYIKTLST